MAPPLPEPDVEMSAPDDVDSSHGSTRAGPSRPRARRPVRPGMLMFHEMFVQQSESRSCVAHVERNAISMVFVVSYPQQLDQNSNEKW